MGLRRGLGIKEMPLLSPDANVLRTRKRAAAPAICLESLALFQEQRNQRAADIPCSAGDKDPSCHRLDIRIALAARIYPTRRLPDKVSRP